MNCEGLVDTHGPHVDCLALGPAEQTGIEGEGAFALAGVEFTPTDVTGGACRRGHRGLIAHPFEQHEPRPVRIAGDGKTADARNVFGAAMHGTARRFDALGINVDVIDGDIAHPGRPDARSGGVFRDRHQPADHRRAHGQDRVGAIGHARILRVPADHAAIKRLGGFGVARHHVVPNEFPVSLGHGRLSFGFRVLKQAVGDGDWI